MTRIYRIPTSQVDGNGSDDNNTDEIRPYGDVGFYIGNNGKLELLMFDGVRTHVNSKVLNKGTFYGGDADSGDGVGLDTIKLVPDENLRQQGSNQYLIVDPTAPNHIHLRAGGTIDNSSADLYIGGEETHVKISDGYDTVTVRTSQSGEGVINRDWVFDNLGRITFPDATIQTTAWTGTAPAALPAVTTVTTGGIVQVTANQEILLCDPNAAGATINLVFPADPSEGKTYTVKNINAGSYVVYVQPAAADAIETDTGTVSTGTYATLTNTGATMTWVYSTGTWRAINKFGV